VSPSRRSPLRCRDGIAPGSIRITSNSILYSLSETQEEYPHLALAPLRDARLVATAIAQALGLRSVSLTWVVAIVLTSLGHLAREQGDYPRAIARYRESLALHRAFGTKGYIAWCFEVSPSIDPSWRSEEARMFADQSSLYSRNLCSTWDLPRDVIPLCERD